MNIVIYGKKGCIDCSKARLLCEMKSIDFQYYNVGTDITVETLHERVGSEVRTVPQIFLQANGQNQYIGGYEELRQQL